MIKKVSFRNHECSQIFQYYREAIKKQKKVQNHHKNLQKCCQKNESRTTKQGLA